MSRLEKTLCPLILLLLLTIDSSNALRVLGLFPHNGVSHFHFFSPIMLGLAEVGHDVTVISHFPEKNPPKHYKDLPLPHQATLFNAVDLKMFETRHFFNHFMEFVLLYQWGIHACNQTLYSDALKQVLNEKTPYDVIIMEQFNTDCLMGIAHVLKAPVIAASSASVMPWHYERMGTPIIPSYIPALFMAQSEDMNFSGRLANWLTIHLFKSMYSFLSMPAADAQLREKFGNNLPSVKDLVKETSVFFVNQHFSYSGAKPLPPSIVELGGIHIKEAKPLDAPFQRYLDEAEFGVIIISWGSMIKADTLSPFKRNAIVEAVRQLKQRIIWKWENDTLPDKPDNLLISKWLPQRDILCHPNVKVFMTHAGLMGSSEAVHCGVPMVATPMYGDQFLNAAALKHRGMGIILPYEDITEETVLSALNTAMEKQYMDNAKKVSYSFKHRPQTALESAIWWVEYVAHTKGAPLTKSSAVFLSRFVYYSLDIYLLFAIVIFIVIYISLLIIRKFCTKRQNLEKYKRS